MKIDLYILEEKKKYLDSLKPFPPHKLEMLNRSSKLELVHMISLLEGGTLSKAETDVLITQELTIGGKTLTEQNNAVMIARTIDWMENSAHLSKYDISEQVLLRLHHLPSIKEENDSLFKPSYRVPYVLSEYVEWLQQDGKNELERALEAYIKVMADQTFGEKNSRTALLLFNLLLLQAGYPLVFISEDQIPHYQHVSQAISHDASQTEPISEVLIAAVSKSLDLYIEELSLQENVPQSQLLKIGQLAQLTNESIPTIRHWTKHGLLQVADYSPGGYQLYEPSLAAVVVKIRELQKSERRTVEEISQIINKPL